MADNAKLQNRRELYFVIFCTGAGILAIEIIASRYMTPMFGSSLYIWGAILSVTLICLSVGYSWAGRMAERLVNPYERLVQLVLISALWIGVLPFLGYPVAYLGLHSGSVFGPILVMSLLFALPITLLATATPLVFGTINREDDGRHAARSIGDLFAISTIGSVAGALLSAYLLIPLLGLRWSLEVVAIVLIAVVSPAVWRGIALRSAVVVVTVMTLFYLTPEKFIPKPQLKNGIQLLERSSSRYGELAVLEDSTDNSRVLLLDGASQNWVTGKHYSVSKFNYIPVMLRHLERFDVEKRAVVLGLGAGTLVRNLAARGYEVEVVDIDRRVFDIAVRYFAFPRESFTVHIEDARLFLQRAKRGGRRYGLVVLDATGGGSHPAHLYNRDAFQMIRDILTPSGLLVTNQVLSMKQGEDEVAHHSAATLGSVFGSVEAFDLYPEDSREGLTNMLVFATDTAPLNSALPAHAPEVKFEFRKDADAVTDDWNPVDVWSVDVADQWHTNVREWLGDAALIPI